MFYRIKILNLVRVIGELLNFLIAAHLISLRGDIGWPARSPDLSPCDYFLWGYVKSEVFKDRPTTIDGLKAAICKTINEIPQEMTQRAMENFRIRLQRCIAVQGGHLEDVIFKIVCTKWQSCSIVKYVIKFSQKLFLSIFSKTEMWEVFLPHPVLGKCRHRNKFIPKHEKRAPFNSTTNVYRHLFP